MNRIKLLLQNQPESVSRSILIPDSFLTRLFIAVGQFKVFLSAALGRAESRGTDQRVQWPHLHTQLYQGEGQVGRGGGTGR